MKQFLALSLALSLALPSAGMAADRRFEEADFNWDDPLLNLYKRIIISGVNMMAREYADCAVMDPKSVRHYGGTPDDPEFEVTCGDAQHLSHHYFSKARVTGDPASSIPLDERQTGNTQRKNP